MSETPSRETDDQAIEALCFLLDHQRAGELSGLASQSGLEGTRGELWSAILRRRLSNAYNTNQTSGASLRAQWMHRHYHVRLLAYPDEGPKRSAAHVALTWNGNENSVRTNASHAVERQSAEEWIRDAADRWQQPFAFDGGKHIEIDYKALDSAIFRLAAEFSS